MFSGWHRIVMGTVVILGSAAFAQASPFGLAGQYNAFIFHDLDAIGGDTEGRLAVGRNATMASYSVGFHSPDSGGTLDHLVVGNDLNAIGHWQVFGGNTKYGGSLISAPSTQPPNTILPGNPVDFLLVQTEMQNLASNLSTLSANGASLYQWSTLHLTGTDPVLNVIDVNPLEWAAASDRQITAPAGSTLILNIAGSVNSMSGGLALHGISRENVLYNFYESTTINSSSIAVLGSVLAPYATLNLSAGAIEGNAVLLNAVQRNGGEFHNYTFQGVPEPTTLALLGLVAGLARRRRTTSKF